MRRAGVQSTGVGNGRLKSEAARTTSRRTSEASGFQALVCARSSWELAEMQTPGSHPPFLTSRSEAGPGNQVPSRCCSRNALGEPFLRTIELTSA